MRRERFNGLTVVVLLGVVAFVAGGCNQGLKQKLASAEAELQDTRSQNEALRLKCAEAANREARANTGLKGAQSQLAMLRAENERLRKRPQPQAAPARPVAKTRAERTVFSEVLASDILFAPGKASLTTRGATALGSVVRPLRAKYADYLIRVSGHTDSDPIKKSKWKNNVELSAHRALAVKRFLVSRDIPAGNIETVAMGSSKPVASNRTRAGKARNRRVEIEVVSR